MKQAGLFVVAVACSALLSAPAANAGGDAGRGGEIEKPAPPPVESNEGYRPRWADPNAKPPEPGIENDPTPFNPADVDTNSDTLNNNIDNVDQ
jgi:hypothetical protein